jgi:hypothetical protein
MIPPRGIGDRGDQWLPSMECVALREALPQRVVEFAELEMPLGCKPIEGSNPSLSATMDHKHLTNLDNFMRLDQRSPNRSPWPADTPRS